MLLFAICVHTLTKSDRQSSSTSADTSQEAAEAFRDDLRLAEGVTLLLTLLLKERFRRNNPALVLLLTSGKVKSKLSSSKADTI